LINTFEENNIYVIWTVNPYNAVDQGDTSVETRGNTKLPKDLDAYAKFLTVAVERYDYVKYWQIHNEINVDKFFWDDTSENYALLLKTSYDAIKAGNPNAKVVIGGMSNPSGVSIGNDYTTIMSELKKLGGTFDVFDIHWYGFVGNYKEHDKAKETLVHFMEESLPTLLDGFDDVEEVWMTEIGTHSGSNVIGQIKFQDQSESEQAIELFKRYAYSISHGISKLFWNKVVESVSYSREFNHKDYFSNIGLIHNGCEYIDQLECDCPNNCVDDPGKNVEKLSYYTYKLMIEKLEGSDWDNVEIIQEDTDNIYAYKFQRGSEEIYLLWWDYFEESNYQDRNTKTISLSELGLSGSYFLTEAVPYYEDGGVLKNSGESYPNFFNKYKVTDKIELGISPVYIEVFNKQIHVSNTYTEIIKNSNSGNNIVNSNSNINSDNCDLNHDGQIDSKESGLCAGSTQDASSANDCDFNHDGQVDSKESSVCT
jgi:hypothetical protein